jgi:hypothetical protein
MKLGNLDNAIKLVERNPTARTLVVLPRTLGVEPAAF